MRLLRFSLPIVLLSTFTGASADSLKNNRGNVKCGAGQCTTNDKGQVKCSKYIGGQAVKNNMGKVMCGKGQCEKNNRGEIHCSRTEWGGAARNNMGEVKCFNGCELGSESMCVDGE